MDEEVSYEDQHGQDWDIHNDHQDGHEEAQEGLLKKYRVTITATVTISATVDVEAKGEEAARAEIRAQLERQGSQATAALVEAAGQAVRKDELDDLDIDVDDDD